MCAWGLVCVCLGGGGGGGKIENHDLEHIVC